jgi:hypothetical protein
MSKFLTTSALNIGAGVGEWETVSPILYASDLIDEVIEIPAGFKTDLASIPRPLQAFIPVNGRHRFAAILHDYLYVHHPKWCTRSLADSIFLEAMADLGESFSRRWAMYAAVRAAGWLYWTECRECKRGASKK